MKRMSLFILTLLILSCNRSGNWSEFSVEYEAKVKIAQKEGTEGKYKITYPYFKDYPELNAIIEKRVSAEEKYINDANGLLEHDVSFGEIRTSGKYIGFMFNMNSYFEGDAHPSTQLFSLNYDIEEKKEVVLKDVFSPLSSDYLDIFSGFTYKELTSRVEKDELKSSDDFISEGTDAKEANFACFNLKGAEVIVVFNQYQVAPYSSGISEVSIPLSIFK